MRRRLEASEAEEVALKARVQGTVEIEARLREAEVRKLSQRSLFFGVGVMQLDGLSTCLDTRP
jgi:tartrate dehydratase alpha subunit/fumarate hydratase class I-like protein